MMKKRILSLMLALATMLSATSFAAAAPVSLSDVKGSWCEEYVNDLLEKGIVSGYADGTYKAGTPVTRGAISKMVFLAMQDAGSTIKEFTSNDPFTDMKGNWAESYVVPLAQIGVIVPSEYNNRFSAGTAMSRLETAKMLVRVYLHAHADESLPASVSLDFTDASQISKEDAPYVAFAVEKGIINGYEDGSFKPSNSINRGTAAAMISRFLDGVGTITDTVMGGESDNRQDGKVDQSTAAAPEIKNVEWVIKPSIKIDYQGTYKDYWSEVSPDGMAYYYTSDAHTDQTIVDLNGNTYHYPGIDVRGDFVNGMAPACDLATGKYGYIDVSGNWVVKPIYDGADSFFLVYLTDGTSQYYGFVQKNDSWYAINENFEVLSSDVIPNTDREKTYGPEYEEPQLSSDCEVFDGPTDDGLFVISAMRGNGGLRKPYYGICDKNGKVLVAPEAATTSYGNAIHTAYDLSKVYDDCILLEQLVSVRYDVLYDIYDGKTGKLIYSCANSQEAADELNVDYRGLSLADYGQGLFVAATEPAAEDSRVSSPVGYMNKYGEMVIPAVFEKAMPFANGYAWVEYDGLWGLIKLPQAA